MSSQEEAPVATPAPATTEQTPSPAAATATAAATPNTNANGANANTAQPQEESKPSDSDEDGQEDADAPGFLCFVCGRCKYPICTSADLLLSTARSGTTDAAFGYNLDCILDLDEAVPCYSADETVDTCVTISRELIDQPLPPAAKILAIEALMESRHVRDAQQRAAIARGERFLESIQRAVERREAQALTANAEHREETTEHPDSSEQQRSTHLTRATTPTAANERDALAEENGITAAGEDEDANADVDADAIHYVGRSRHNNNNSNNNNNNRINNNSVAAADGGAPSEGRPQRVAASNIPPSNPNGRSALRRFGESKTSRIDLVCLRGDVAKTGGLTLCTRDRSATVVPDTDPASVALLGEARRLSYISPESASAAQRPPPPTAWRSPGNFDVSEAFIQFHRSTSSSTCAWFGGYRCTHRVQCPDCHLGLGFFFESYSNAASGQARKTRQGERAGTAAAAGEEEGEENEEEGVSARPEGGAWKRSKTEEGAVPAGSAAGGSTADAAEEQHVHAPVSPAVSLAVHHASGASSSSSSSSSSSGDSGAVSPDGNAGDTQAQATTTTTTGEKQPKTAQATPTAATGDDDGFPSQFIGLELKNIVQRKWTLRRFHERYRKTATLETFRDMFPEAEELHSLFSRLTALRTQNELYGSLLRKHKEQNDVQTTLLVSQKERMGTYDEKLHTMEQIIEAQRLQLEMQSKQLSNQETLLRSHRQQVGTQQRQIQVEQQLLAEQHKTIENQREQIRLMKAHLETLRAEGNLASAARTDVDSTSATVETEADATQTTPAEQLPPRASVGLRRVGAVTSGAAPSASTASTATATAALSASATRMGDTASRVAAITRHYMELRERKVALEAAAAAAARATPSQQPHSSVSASAIPSATSAATAAAPTPTTAATTATATTESSGELPPLHLRSVYGAAQRPTASAERPSVASPFSARTTTTATSRSEESPRAPAAGEPSAKTPRTESARGPSPRRNV